MGSNGSPSAATGCTPNFAKRIVKLLVDELDAGVKIFQRCGLGIQSAIQAVEDRQQCGHRIGKGVFLKLLLLLLTALAKVFELGLNAGRAIKISRAFGPHLLQFRLRFFGGGAGLRSRFVVSTFAWRKLVVQLQFRLAGASIVFLCLHNFFYVDSFQSLSNSRAMYDTAVMVCS